MGPKCVIVSGYSVIEVYFGSAPWVKGYFSEYCAEGVRCYGKISNQSMKGNRIWLVDVGVIIEWIGATAKQRRYYSVISERGSEFSLGTLF